MAYQVFDMNFDPDIMKFRANAALEEGETPLRQLMGLVAKICERWLFAARDDVEWRCLGEHVVNI